MTSTHPSLEVLAGYASGTISEGRQIFVSAHLNFCSKCRRDVSTLESIGGEILRCNSVLPVSEKPSLKKTMRAIERLESQSSPNTEGTSIVGGKFPSIINNLIGSSSEKVAWRFRLPGIYDYPIANRDGEDIYLLKADPGAHILQHTHEGEEATLVLCGKMKDKELVLSRGDVSFVDEKHTHKPEIIGNETCICLVVMSGKLKFTGRFTRALNYLS